MLLFLLAKRYGTTSRPLSGGLIPEISSHRSRSGRYGQAAIWKRISATAFAHTAMSIRRYHDRAECHGTRLNGVKLIFDAPGDVHNSFQLGYIFQRREKDMPGMRSPIANII